MITKFEELTELAVEIRPNNIIDSRGEIIHEDWEEGVSLSKFGTLIVNEALEKLRPYLFDQFYEDTCAELRAHFGIKND
jgi:hypothetical protein